MKYLFGALLVLTAFTLTDAGPAVAARPAAGAPPMNTAGADSEEMRKLKTKLEHLEQSLKTLEAERNAENAALRQNTQEARMERERASRAAESAEKAQAVAQWANTIQIAYMTLLVALITFGLIYAIRLLQKARKSGEDADTILQEHKSHIDLLKITTDSLKSDESITDKPIEDIRKAAAPSAPFAAAMLASMKKDWNDARFLWGQVLRANPDSNEAKFQLAFALHELGEETPGDNDKQVLYNKAAGLYEELTKTPSELPKEDSTVWNNWGFCLSSLADLEAEPDKKKELLLLAAEKHVKAVSLDQDNDTAWNNWGSCLPSLADLEAEPDKKKELLIQAAEKHAKAVSLDQDNSTAWNDWGFCLSSLADLEAEPGKKKELFLLAAEKREKAILLDQGNSTAWNNWGFCLSSLADLETAPNRKKELLQRAAEKYARAVSLDEDNSVAWNNWGTCLPSLADLEAEADKKKTLLLRAAEKYAKAVNLNQDNSAVWNNWGWCLAALAEAAASPKEKNDRLSQAEEKYRTAITRDTANAVTWSNLGKTQLQQGLLAQRQDQTKEAERLFAEARASMKKAHELKPGAGRNNLARLELASGDEEACRTQLEEALKHNALPPIERMLTDPLLESVRERGWFIAIIEEMRKKLA